MAIVHYRSYRDLAACLESIATFEPALPVVVVDHASDPKQLLVFRSRFASVRFLDTPANPGFAAGANRAVRALGTTHVLLVNPDCVLTEPVAPVLTEVFDANAAIAIAGPCVLNRDGSVQPSARRFPNATTALGGRRSWLTALAPGNWLSRRNLLTASPGDATRLVDWVSGACMMVSREAFDAVGGFDDSYFLYWEDADFARRLLTRGYRVAYHPRVSLVHAGAGCSRFNPMPALIAFHVSALRYYARHAGPAGKIATPVVALLLGGRLLASLAYHGIVRCFERQRPDDPGLPAGYRDPIP